MDSDETLLQQYRTRRNADAFAELGRRYAGLVYSAALRVTGRAHDAEDVAQECFVELARRAEPVHCPLPAWLHVVAVNKSRNVVRSRTRRERHELAAACAATTRADATWTGLVPHVDEAIAELPDELRVPLVAQYLQGRCQAEIAATLEINQSTVSRRVEKGIEAIREHLKEAGVVAASANLPRALGELASGSSVPPSLVASLGRLAMAGVGPGTKPGLGVKIMSAASSSALVGEFIAALVVLATLIAALTYYGREGSSMANSATTQQAQKNRVSIESVPPLYWGRGQDTTYCGAMAAALAAVGPKLDYDTLMGDSGLAFRVRWWRTNDGPGWCPSSPVGEFSPWTDAVEASAGWRAKWETHLDNVNGVTDMMQFREQVVQSIDAGRPVLAYMGNLDVSVLYGYEADAQRVLVRSYYTGDNETIMPLSENKGMLMFLAEKKQELPRREAVIAGLKAAVRDWKAAPTPASSQSGPGAYHMGDDAYATWIADTEKASQLSDADRQGMHHPRGWTFAELVDARYAASRYLRKSAGAFGGEAKAAMERAADLYEQTAKSCGKARFDDKDAFTFGDSGTFEQWTAEMRLKEAAVLVEARRLDAQAVAELDKALAAMVP